AAGDGGMHINLDNVHLRAENMSAADILSSESQERMMAVVTPDNVDAFMEICAKWEVIASDLGEVTDGEHLVIEHQGEVVVDADAASMADEGPVYERPYAKPDTQDSLNETPDLARPTSADQLRQTVLDLAASPALCSRAYITEQYDRYVRGNTVLAKDADGGVLRIDEETGRGIAGVMWQFREAVHGLADGAAELGIPVTGGNVSFYNQTGSDPILPTPVIAVLGTIDDVATRIPAQAPAGEYTLLLAGKATADELGGSIWQQVAHSTLAGLPPQVDLADEQKLGAALSALRGTVASAHDLSEGGLSQALVEFAVQAGAAVSVDPVVSLASDAAAGDAVADTFTALFSETASRVLVAVAADKAAEAESVFAANGVPVVTLGKAVVSGDATDVEGQVIEVTTEGASFTLPVAEAKSAWEGTLPGLFSHAVGANSVVD
ncbi:AIR synthase-related protein, partial [Corynebacterium variabile]|uniref:AIR synthase-related protein n=1 Tax=Corynebacterium variabile TaxID=1727 RepID=UPI003F8E05A6